MPKPRTRTFLGCLTCRKRKVKCDLGKPTCHNCHRLKLAYRDYEVTLHWLPQWLPTLEDEDAACPGRSSPPPHGGRMRTLQPHGRSVVRRSADFLFQSRQPSLVMLLMLICLSQLNVAHARRPQR